MNKSQAVYFDTRNPKEVYNELYEMQPDPWGHLTNSTHLQVDRLLMNNALSLLTPQCSDNTSSKKLLVEIGCGLGQNIETLRNIGFDVIGTEVSDLAVNRGRQMHPDCELVNLDVTSGHFADFLHERNPDVLYFCHVTWCIIAKIDLVLDVVRKYSQQSSKDIFMAHLTAIYPPGMQRLGSDKFTNSREIINYFKPSEVVFSGEIWPDQNSGCALLVSKI